MGGLKSSPDTAGDLVNACHRCRGSADDTSSLALIQTRSYCGAWPQDAKTSRCQTKDQFQILIMNAGMLAMTDWLTNTFSSQVISNSLFSTEVKDRVNAYRPKIARTHL